MKRKIIRIDEEKCNGCGACADRLLEIGRRGLRGEADVDHQRQ